MNHATKYERDDFMFMRNIHPGNKKIHLEKTIENSDFLEFCMGIDEPTRWVEDFSSKEGPYASFEVLAS